MLGHDGAAADVDGGGADFVDVQQVECDAGSYNVGDGIRRTDFVEMDLLYGYAVDFGFGFGQTLKHGGRILFRFRGDLGAVDQGEDV